MEEEEFDANLPERDDVFDPFVDDFGEDEELF